ncbi:hypothetical protein ACFO5Q_17270 [Kordiimonas lipolytica]|uniref:UrcA family protein n=1 Tax=Kordiimonas lipolytica TaxID=1662421 RepID=A0ABV8UF91_9PROT|nr:hypothetical protein [Kordiimonas lipolytica]
MKSTSKVTVVTSCFALLTTQAQAQNFPPLQISADPSARYEVLDVTQRADGMFEIVTKRTGKSGISYAKRLVDCRSQTAKYLGDGETLESMERSKPSPRMGPLVEGSSTHAVAMYACTHGATLAAK